VAALSEAPSVNKSNYYTYGVKLDKIPEDSTLLLYQNYHPGWKAYEINSKDQKSKIKKLFPFIFGRELRDHVLVNNWANGWKISQSQLNQSKPVGNSKLTDSNRISPISTDSHVVILFWPQYLEYLGFFMLIITFLSILPYPKAKLLTPQVHAAKK
jgi:hypothetical protein